MTPSWAVLLVKLTDQNVEPFTPTEAELRFTGLGRGTGNLVDYFLDMSHGRLDLSVTRVFGWLPSRHSVAERAELWAKYQQEDQRDGTSLANIRIRTDVQAWGREAATDQGIDLKGFDGIIVVFSGLVDYFGSYGSVVLQWNAADPTLASIDLTGAAHEWAHGMGFAHSRMEGSGDEYGDDWDIMSAYEVHSWTNGTRYDRIGPGMNAASPPSWARSTATAACSSTPQRPGKSAAPVAPATHDRSSGDARNPEHPRNRQLLAAPGPARETRRDPARCRQPAGQARRAWPVGLRGSAAAEGVEQVVEVEVAHVADDLDALLHFDGGGFGRGRNFEAFDDFEAGGEGREAAFQEEVFGADVEARGPGSGHHLDRQDRIASELEKMVFGTHLWHIQDLLPDQRQGFFRRGRRLPPLGCGLGFGCRQGAAVDLAVGGQREGF